MYKRQSLACLKRSRTLEAPMPTNISTNSDPEMEKKGTSASPATALASMVLPVPGGPTSRMPLGLSLIHIFVLPIMKPALAVQAIFSFVASWNNYFIPALVLDSADKKTLPILIAQDVYKRQGLQDALRF